MFRFYESPTHGRSRVTVVGKHEDNKLSIAVARCSSKDQFIRKKGRAIAEERLANNKTYLQVEMPHCDVRTFLTIAKGVTSEVENSKVVIRTT